MKEHVLGYINSGALIIKYEDLKKDALSEAKRISQFLNISRSEDDLVASINNQSFESKKKKLLESNQLNKANFLRKGATGEWREALSANNIDFLT